MALEEESTLSTSNYDIILSNTLWNIHHLAKKMIQIIGVITTTIVYHLVMIAFLNCNGLRQYNAKFKIFRANQNVEVIFIMRNFACKSTINIKIAIKLDK